MTQGVIGAIVMTVEAVVEWIAAHPEADQKILDVITKRPTRAGEVGAARAAGDAAIDAYEDAKVKP